MSNESTPERAKSPTVSIVIPAYQAAATLDRALDSLRDQTFADWEVIVVDDGSDDATHAVATKRAEADARIRVLRQANKGASAARNLGLRETRGAWIGFLDADDWFDKAFLRTLLDIAEREPDAGVVYCDFALVDNDGRILEEQRVPELTDPFLELGMSCLLSVHCALTRAAIMQEAGEFDETLEVNEDWDLWQRIARTGAKFHGVSEILAFYYNRPQSLSRTRLRALAVDGVEVINRVCRADPRVPSRDPRYVNGLPAETKLLLQLDWILMCAANAIALDQDPLEYLDLVPDLSSVALIAQASAPTFLGGLAFGRCTDVRSLSADWEKLAPLIDGFFDALNAKVDQPRSIDTIKFIIRHRILGGATAIAHFKSDVVYACRVDIAKPLKDIDPGACDAVIAEIVDGETVLGFVEMPALGPVPAAALAQTIGEVAPYWPERKMAFRRLGMVARPLFWTRLVMLGLRTRGWGARARMKTPGLIAKGVPLRARSTVARAFGETIAARLRYSGDAQAYASAIDVLAAEEASKVLSTPTPIVDPEKVETAWREVEVNSPEYWDQVFEQENPWAYDSRYEQTKYEQTLSMIPKEKPKRALELACAEGHFTVQLAPYVETLLATDISETAIKRAAGRCRAYDHLSYAQLDFFNKPIQGEYDLIVCSEVLYECGSMDRLQNIARNIADHLTPNGALVMAHIIEASEERDRSGFDWGGVFGSKSIADVFSATKGMTLEAQIETELYRIHRFRKDATVVEPTLTVHQDIGAPPEPEYAAYVVWGGAKVTRSEAAIERAVALPVLMYHRVAPRDDGPASLAQYRVTPEAFEQQLRWLRQNGYHAIEPQEWISAVRENRSLPGRPVLLTFDDGYRDFATTAWPLLQHYGLPATVAVVTEKVGGTADWDAAFGEPAPLMTWAEIQAVHAAGANVASHSATHPSFPASGATEVLRQALRSRAALARALGEAPSVMIYPYGAYDPLAARACSLAGYEMAFGTGPGTATLLSEPMHMPRIDVSGFDDLDAFVERVTRIDGQSGLKSAR